jgi:hypothetical protein
MPVTKTIPTKKSEWFNKLIDKLMLLTGTLAVAWILLFLLVALLDK